MYSNGYAEHEKAGCSIIEGMEGKIRQNGHGRMHRHRRGHDYDTDLLSLSLESSCGGESVCERA